MTRGKYFALCQNNLFAVALLKLVVLLLIVGPKAMNSVAATIVCMKLLGHGFSFRPAYLAQLLPFHVRK